MPITQQRVLDVLDEIERLQSWAQTLRADIFAVLETTMSPEAKLEAIDALVVDSPPACVRAAVEQDHFRRARRRNERSAKKMQAKRAGITWTQETEREQANAVD